MRPARRCALVLGSLAVLVVPIAPADAARSWAPAATATVRPGVQTFTAGAQCTANFVFTDAVANVYIGQAAHCSGTGGSTETNGCTAASLPLGTSVTVTGAATPATLVYNSWLTMQDVDEADPNACQDNDFALLRLDPTDVAKVNPSIPFWGGPVSLSRSGTPRGQSVYSYGNSSLRLGLSLLSPKRGVSLGDAGAGWTHQVNTITPGLPGDSGSAFLDARGRAIGVLSTLQIGLPGGVSNGVSDLARALDYLDAHSDEFPGLSLATGTVAFNGNRLPLGI